MRYGTISYAAIGRVFPRQRLRENPLPVLRSYRPWIPSAYTPSLPSIITGQLCLSPLVTGAALSIAPVTSGELSFQSYVVGTLTLRPI